MSGELDGEERRKALARLRRIVTDGGKFGYGSDGECLDVVEGVFESYRRMCSNLQGIVQEFGLGLGGEQVDELVCGKLRELFSAANAIADPRPTPNPETE